MADPGKYRTKEEVEEWKRKDPLILAKARLNRDYPPLGGELARIEAEVEAEVQDAVRFAHEAPEPDAGTVEEFTYINE